MTDDPKLQMARRVVAKTMGWASFEEAEYHNRQAKYYAAIALAAIEECTERAAKLAIGWRDENKSSIDDGDQSLAAQKVRGAAIEMNAFARALRSGDHLKGPIE